MCNFKSMIVTKDGDILHINGDDSHENIIDRYKCEYELKDDQSEPKKLMFARIEIAPPNEDVFEKDLKKWKFKIDQNITPTWFKKTLEKKCFEELEKILSEIIIDGQNIDLIENKNGLYIRNSEISKIRNCKIEYVGGSASIEYVGGSASIEYVGGSASIKYVRDSASIESVGDSASIKYVGDSASIKYVVDSASIEYVGGSASIKYVGGSASIESVGDSASIEYVERF